MQIGDKVLVPRSNGDVTPGEVIEVYTNHARVRFLIGDYYRGKPAPDQIKGEYGYKTLRISELREAQP